MKANQEWPIRVPKTMIGATITEVRLLEAKELANLGWDGERAVVIFLSNGDFLIPSRDPEGNGPGVIFTKDKTIC